MTLLALILATLILGWIAAGVLLRAAGLLTLAVGLALAPSHPAGLVLAALGTVLWLTGHWLYALRHHAYKSPLARRIYLGLLPRRFDPTRDWTIPTTTTTEDD
jgi:hypothetical protein